MLSQRDLKTRQVKLVEESQDLKGRASTIVGETKVVVKEIHDDGAAGCHVGRGIGRNLEASQGVQSRSGATTECKGFRADFDRPWPFWLS